MYSDGSGHFDISILMAFAVLTAVTTISVAISGGVAAAKNGGDSNEIWSGIGKGALTGFVLGGSISLAIGGFIVGGTTILGSMMVTYGLSVASNLCEVSWVQAKKSLSDGDSLSAMRNDVNNAMFANLGNILIGKPTLMSIPFYGTRMTSKIPTIFNVLVSYDLDKFFGSTTFLASAKATLLSKASPFGLAIGYVVTAVQYYHLIRAIVTTPDFENSRWILY